MARDGHRTLRLDEQEPIPWRDGDDALRWLPVRSLLGLRAFGASAFRAAAAGEVLVHEHVEAAEGRDHEELYVVISGAALFEVGTDRVTAAVGTLLRVDAATRRRAVALEPGTTVLVLGREPSYAPAGHEYLLRVRAAARDPAAAETIAAAGREELPESPGVWYASALAAACAGEEQRARDWLARATSAVPELVEEARALDPALARLLPDGP